MDVPLRTSMSYLLQFSRRIIEAHKRTALKMDLIELKVPTVDGPVSCGDHLQSSEVEKKREKNHTPLPLPSLLACWLR